MKTAIETHNFIASARSAGRMVEFGGKAYPVEELTKESFKGVERMPAAIRLGSMTLPRPGLPAPAITGGVSSCTGD